MSSSATEGLKKPASRVYFVDALRLIASFQMVNGHTLDAIIAPSVRESSWFGTYLWFRGLVAVAFLLVSGIAFHLSTVQRFEKHRADKSAVRRRFQRCGWLVFWGYALHNPFGMIGASQDVQAAIWRDFLSVDVLACIGVTLAVLEGIVLFAPSPRSIVIAAGTLASAIFLLTPVAADAIQDGSPHALWNWFSHAGGSRFPLFPWAGYVCAGIVIGGFVLPEGGTTPFRKTASRMAVLFAIAGLVWSRLEAFPLPWFDLERHGAVASPALVAERLFAVLGLLLVLDFLCRPIRSFPPILRTLSRETLAIYIIHLLILFGPLLQVGARIGPRLDLGPALCVSGLNLLATTTLVLLWQRSLAQRRQRKAP